MKRSRSIDLLKGVAIVLVLTSHYIKTYVNENYFGFANGFVGILFLIAGYLSFLSLQQKTSGQFLLNRVVRIVPLYILARSLGNSDVYWFVAFLMHCYIAAPLLFSLLERAGVRSYLLILFLLLTIFSFISPLEPEYRKIFLSHVILFGVGMVIPRLKPLRHISIFFSTIILAFLIYATRGQTGNSPLTIGISAFFIVFSAIYFWGTMSTKITKGFFGLSSLGKYSYSLYLFHPHFFTILEKLHLTHVALLLLPVYLLFCYSIETLYTSLIKLKKQ